MRAFPASVAARRPIGPRLLCCKRKVPVVGGGDILLALPLPSTPVGQ